MRVIGGRVGTSIQARGFRTNEGNGGQQRPEHCAPHRRARIYAGLTRDDLLSAYRTMVLSRRIDDKEIQLKNQSLIFFQISGAGHEAILVAAGMHAEARLRLVLPLLPRPRVVPDARHDAVRDVPGRRRREGRSQLRAAGRCRRTGATSGSTSCRSPARPARSVCTQSAAPRPALLYEHDRPPSKAAIELFQPDEVVYLSVGDGATSEGEFWESLNTACIGKLPVVCVVEDNGYAISVPVEVQTAGGDISKLVVVVSRSVRAERRRHRLPRELPCDGATPWPMRARARVRRSFTRR